MLNNRQNGRRRGRGGQRPQGGAPNRPEQGNRIDNRARGNAAQLLEKYKSLARDAQTQGDRVNAEYFLQFADHYFRVLGESRSRLDEQRRARGDDGQDEEYDGDDNRADYAANDRGDEQQRYDRNDRPERTDRPERNDRQDRNDRPERNDRPREDRPRERAERTDRPQRAERPYRDDRGPDQEREPQQQQHAQPVNGGGAPDEGDRPRRGRPRRELMNGDAAHEPAPAFDASLLPPSIAQSAPEASGEAEAPRRRGRPRKVVEPTPDAA